MTALILAAITLATVWAWFKVRAVFGFSAPVSRSVAQSVRRARKAGR